MGLLEKKVPYELIRAPPHSEVARLRHPFGRIPAFCHKRSDVSATTVSAQDLWLFESNAITHYIDRTWNRPRYLSDQSSERSAIIDQWCSAVSDYVFNTLEHGIIKPRVQAQSKNADPAATAKSLEPARQKGREVLAVFEKLANDSSVMPGGYLLGELTWVDLYLAPIVADLLAVVDGSTLLSPATTPSLCRWWHRVESLDSFTATYAGTLADQLRVIPTDGSSSTSSAAKSS